MMHILVKSATMPRELTGILRRRVARVRLQRGVDENSWRYLRRTKA